MYLIIAILSLLISWFLLFIIGRNALIRSGVFVIYLAWHSPLIISILVPFTFPLQEEDNALYIMFILIMIHIIQFGGVLAWIKNKNKKEKINPFNIYKYNLPFIYILGAYLAPVLSGIDNFLLKGLSISLNLADNRELATTSTTPLSLLVVVFTGFCLYLINFAFEFKNNKVIFNLFYFLPYILTTLVLLLSGNRQFLFIGLILSLFKLISIIKPSIKQLIKWLALIILVTIPFGIGFQFLRQSALEGRQDIFIISILKISIIDNHPLKSLFESNSFLYLISLYIYAYFGTQYDTLSAIIKTTTENVPFGSLTFPVLYRRWSNFFGLPEQEEIRLSVHTGIEHSYGIFPRIWTTMYGGICYEGGVIYIIIYSLLLSYIHFYLVKKYLINQSVNNIFNLIVFYCFITFGIINIGTYEVSFFFLILIAIYSSLFRVFYKGRKFDKQL